MLSVTFDSCTRSNSVGPSHTENQDSFLVDRQNLLFAVADGVGGYSGAKEASSIAAESLEEYAPKIIDENSLEESISEIHERILKRSKALHFPNMGTTLAVAKILQNSETMIIGNVGDSPIFLFRDDSIEFVYEDDSTRSYDPLSMYAMIQYLGVDQKIDIHTRTLWYNPGDVILLCSDGVTDNILNSTGGREELVSLVKLKSAEKIVECALKKRIKRDDMTSVLVFLDSQ